MFYTVLGYHIQNGETFTEQVAATSPAAATATVIQQLCGDITEWPDGPVEIEVVAVLTGCHRNLYDQELHTSVTQRLGEAVTDSTAADEVVPLTLTVGGDWGPAFLYVPISCADWIKIMELVSLARSTKVTQMLEWPSAIHFDTVVGGDTPIYPPLLAQDSDLRAFHSIRVAPTLLDPDMLECINDTEADPVLIVDETGQFTWKVRWGYEYLPTSWFVDKEQTEIARRLGLARPAEALRRESCAKS
jgi:hypothetical protein